MEVKDMIKKLDDLDLVVEPGANHYKVYNSDGSRFLTSFSKTPSDRRWHHNVTRDLRKAGYEIKERKVQDKRQSAVRMDLHKFLAENEKWLKEESRDYGERSAVIAFARHALNYDSEKTWKNLQSAEQSLRRFLKGGTVRYWVLDIIEATMDIWRKEVPEPQSIRVDEPLPEELDWNKAEVRDPVFDAIEDLTLKERYASVLLSMLEKGVDDPDALVQILDRLDRLVL